MYKEHRLCLSIALTNSPRLGSLTPSSLERCSAAILQPQSL
jgi:hypothetical protein